MCKRWNWELNMLKLQEKERVCNPDLYWNSYFQTSYTVCFLLPSLPNLVINQKVIKEKGFPFVVLSENIHNLLHTYNSCQRLADQ